MHNSAIIILKVRHKMALFGVSKEEDTKEALSVTTPPQKSEKAFLSAINSNNLEEIIRNFDTEYSENSYLRYNSYEYPLDVASAIENNYKVVKFLLESGASPFINQNCLIKNLIKNNDIIICKYFLKNIEIDKINLTKILDITKNMHKIQNTTKSLIQQYCLNKLGSWKKGSQHTISNIECDLNTEVTVKSIFNFFSAKKITVISDAESKLIKEECFADIEDKQELELAYDKLIEQGGTPDKSKIYGNSKPPKNTNKLHKIPMVRQDKQKTAQNINSN